MTIITEVLFAAIVISLIFIVYAMASPIIYSMQVSSAFDHSESFMLDLDNVIQQVASEGRGSRRSVYVSMGAGTVSLNETTDTIKWVLESDTALISPRSVQQVGNLLVGSNLDVMAHEGTYQGQGAYVLENQRLRVYLKKIGSATAPASYSTEDILLAVYNKNENKWMPLERLEISVDNNPDSMSGTGYTELVSEGYNLPRGQVLAHINTSYAFMQNYTISFTLESGADFVIIGAEA
jgi:hypothetical protein